jgi:hypothetical protein
MESRLVLRPTREMSVSAMTDRLVRLSGLTVGEVDVAGLAQNVDIGEAVGVVDEEEEVVVVDLSDPEKGTMTDTVVVIKRE